MRVVKTILACLATVVLNFFRGMTFVVPTVILPACLMAGITVLLWYAGWHLFGLSLDLDVGWAAFYLGMGIIAWMAGTTQLAYMWSDWLKKRVATADDVNFFYDRLISALFRWAKKPWWSINTCLILAV